MSHWVSHWGRFRLARLLKTSQTEPSPMASFCSVLSGSLAGVVLKEPEKE